MPNYQVIDLGPFTKGDTGEIVYFVFDRIEFSVGTKKLSLVEPDLATEFDWIKFSARHSDNHANYDDHTKDDLYKLLDFDGANVAHLTFPNPNELKAGKYKARVHVQKTDGTQFHPPVYYVFTIESVMAGDFGDI